MRENLRRALAICCVSSVLLGACNMKDVDESWEVSSAETTAPKCSADWIRDKCQVATPYVPKAKTNSINIQSGTALPGAGCNEFSCSDFGGSFCRCAESLCPGITGKLLYQQVVQCTYYYNCDHLSLNHVMDIICDPIPGDPTKKHCKCIEPQPWKNEGYNYVYGEGDLGINDNPPPLWCQDVVCKAWLGPSGWRGCGGDTKTTCDNANGRDRCPADCCVNADGSLPAWCMECKRDALPTCGPKPPAGKVQCVTCAGGGQAPRCQGTVLDASGKTVPNGVDEPCGTLSFLIGGMCPAAGTGWSDAPAPGGCNPR